MPPLNLMLTVEAVTRLGSFKRAAEALRITPSAVSHRIRALEGQLGRPLFDRVGQGIAATKEAHRLAEVVGRAQREIAVAWREICAEGQSATVRVSCMAAFAGNFILPDMVRFRRAFPQFELDLTSALYTGSERERRNDVLISSGPHPGPEWSTEDIMPMDMQAIVATNALSSMVQDGVLCGPLLAYTTNSITWANVAALLGLAYQPGATIITLDSVEAACAAAERGLGVALAPVSTVRRLVKAGTVTTIGNPLPTGLSYWFAVKRERKDDAVLAAFRRWVLGVVAASDG